MIQSKIIQLCKVVCYFIESMSPGRTLSAHKKTKNKPAEKGKITPKRLVEKDLSVGQSSAESNDMKILDAWNGLKIVKVVNLRKPE